MFKKVICLLAAMVFIVSCSGCATIVHGTNTTVYIHSKPPGAEAHVAGATIITPGTISLKNNQSYIVTFKKEGYKDAELSIQKEISGWVWGNIVLGGLIGLGIDIMTGGAYKLNPTYLEAELEPAGPVCEPGTKPVVETVCEPVSK